MERVDGRQPGDLRKMEIELNPLRHPIGSAMIRCGQTRVLCAATLTDRVPGHKVGTGEGWLTAEYAMLPGATAERVPRDGTRGRVASRSVEIQRLIGRALRSVFDLKKFGERCLIVDCDVIEADGGTRTASISGAFVALASAVRTMHEREMVSSKTRLLTDFLASTSVGICEGEPVLDLCYLEDAQAEVDMNVVATGEGRLVEVQGTAEGEPFSRRQLDALMDLAFAGCSQIVEIQKSILGVDSVDEL